MRVFTEIGVIRWAKSALNPSLRIPHLSLTRKQSPLWARSLACASLRGAGRPRPKPAPSCAPASLSPWPCPPPRSPARAGLASRWRGRVRGSSPPRSTSSLACRCASDAGAVARGRPLRAACAITVACGFGTGMHSRYVVCGTRPAPVRLARSASRRGVVTPAIAWSSSQSAAVRRGVPRLTRPFSRRGVVTPAGVSYVVYGTRPAPIRLPSCVLGPSSLTTPPAAPG